MSQEGDSVLAMLATPYIHEIEEIGNEQSVQDDTKSNVIVCFSFNNQMGLV